MKISFLDKYPEFVKKYWDSENTCKPCDITYGSAKILKFHCKEGCGNHKWQTSPNNIRIIQKCTICSGTKVCPCGCNSLLKKFPEIEKIWDYELNEKEPNEYLPMSNIVVKWHCKKDCGNHKWESQIDNVTKSVYLCPFCAKSNGKVCPCRCNTLSAKFPEISKEWDDELNKDSFVNPRTLTYGSGYPAYWKCKDCGYKWKTDVNKRTCLNTGCPDCSKKRVGESHRLTNQDFYNKIKIKWPNYLELFSFEKTIYINYDTLIVVTCNKHGDFKILPDVFLRRNTIFGCRQCSKKGYSEIAIKWLKWIEIKKNITLQHACNGGEFRIPKISQVDGYCKENNTIYEFHGDYWHGNPKIYNPYNTNATNGQLFGKLYENTINKKQKCLDLGYNYIEIWESEWNNLINNIIKIQRLWRKKHFN